jgi:hypothetical protein
MNNPVLYQDNRNADIFECIVLVHWVLGTWGGEQWLVAGGQWPVSAWLRQVDFFDGNFRFFHVFWIRMFRIG